MKKRITDMAIAFVCLAIFGIAWAYPKEVAYRVQILWVSGILTVGFIFLALRERDGRDKENAAGRQTEQLPAEAALITEIVLLSEENTELMVWNLYGKTAALIGRDVRENHVDIDLSQSPYASMVDVEHAVLNFSAGSWYVEDLGSANGLSVKKAGDGKTYSLSADTPCRLEKGDCLNVGMNRLLLR